MLKKLKRTTLISLKAVGGFRLFEQSAWRRERLLILAYHGISLGDEHEWDGSLYMAPEVFRARLRLIRESGCAVLPLGEALGRLAAGDLPEKCVSITFDDGMYDFYREALPALKEFGFPATLYLTTFYSYYNRPVFTVMCNYLLWKGRGATLDLGALTGQGETIDLSTGEARAAAFARLVEFAGRERLSAEEKDALVASLAARLGVDYDSLVAQRVLHLLKPEEVKRLAEEGVDIQLHTHRHRTPLDRALFLREIEDNRRSIREMTGAAASHFCYPSGVYDPAFLPWLEESGVESATTCDAGFAARDSSRLLLPRLLDTSSLSPIEFEGWLTGVSALLPRRQVPAQRAA